MLAWYGGDSKIRMEIAMVDRDLSSAKLPLKGEFDFYLANQNELVERFDGRVIVIKDRQVLGDYDDELAALTASRKHHSMGTFLVQRVSPGDRDYACTYHSRVAFP